MAPELIMLGVLAYMAFDNYRTFRKRRDPNTWIGFGMFAGLLFWGNFFNDIGSVVRAGFARLFN